MNTRTVVFILLALGLILAALSLFADTLGLGEGSGMGYKQIAGLVVGIVVALAGVFLLRRK